MYSCNNTHTTIVGNHSSGKRATSGDIGFTKSWANNTIATYWPTRGERVAIDLRPWVINFVQRVHKSKKKTCCTRRVYKTYKLHMTQESKVFGEKHSIKVCTYVHILLPLLHMTVCSSRLNCFNIFIFYACCK